MISSNNQNEDDDKHPIKSEKSETKLPLSRGCHEVTGVAKVTSAVQGLAEFHRFNYNTKLNDRAKGMARAMTKAEQILWFNVLKSNKLRGYKFTKQKQVFNYILDFYCSKLLLVIEVDGSSHNDRLEYDRQRDDFLRLCGLKIIRISNIEVEKNLEGVYVLLLKVIDEREVELKMPKSKS